MALFLTVKGVVSRVEVRTSKKGKEYVSCCLAINSKSRDKNGDYTIDDPTLFLNCISFNKNAVSYLTALPKEKGSFSEVMLMMHTQKKEDGKSTTRTEILKASDGKSQKKPNVEIEENDAEMTDEEYDGIPF